MPLALTALPSLALLGCLVACPVMMVMMMGSMRARGNEPSKGPTTLDGRAAPTAEKERIAELERQLADLQERPIPPDPGGERTAR